MASSDKIKVVLLASEWSSKHGGLSTLNRELAKKLAKHSDVQVSVFLPKCDDKERVEALKNKITLVPAKRMAASNDEIQWLCHPPKELEIDFIIGHGVVLGYPAQTIREYRQCKWVQFVHTDPEELGMYKGYKDAISIGEEKHKNEVELCTMADFVVAVGPKLAEAYRSILAFWGKNVFDLTPGIFSEFAEVRQSKQEGGQFQVLAFGRGDDEDFHLKGFDIAAEAVGKVNNTKLIFVGAAQKKQEEVAARLKKSNLPTSRLIVKTYKEFRDELKPLFSRVDLAIMPSRTEGFGLAALEALSAGLPVLVSGNSGFGKALSKVPFGSAFVIAAEDSPEVWADEIRKVKEKPRETRLIESKSLLKGYAEIYDWKKQTRDLVEKMKALHSDPSLLSPPNDDKGKEEYLLTEESVPSRKARQSAAKESEANTQRRAEGFSASSSSSTAGEDLPLVLKSGCPVDDELQRLSVKLGNEWDKLARRLGLKDEIPAFDADYKKLADKALGMLSRWMNKNGSEATYIVLSEALCHDFVGRRDLAEEFCFKRE